MSRSPFWLFTIILALGGAEPIISTIKPFALPAPAEMIQANGKRLTNLVKVSTGPEQTNVVTEFRVSTVATTEFPNETKVELFESMNSKPILGIGKTSSGEIESLLRRLPKEGVFKKNPNTRHNPLEVDGW